MTLLMLIRKLLKINPILAFALPALAMWFIVALATNTVVHLFRQSWYKN
jgi:hypothetical protein